MNSMTGFGVARREVAGWQLRAEVQTLNGRFLSTRLHLPDELRDLTPTVEDTLKSAFRRGSVHCRVSLEPGREARGRVVDLEGLEELSRSIQEVRRRLGLAGEVTPEWLLAVPGVAGGLVAAGPQAEALLSAALEAVGEAVAGAEELRRAEGANIQGHLEEHRETIARLVAELRQRAPEGVAGYRDRLRERVEALLAGTEVSIEEGALERELAHMAERSDVTEELNRIESHLAALQRSVASTGPQGRRLEFLVQELGREAHTVGAKAADSEMARAGLALRQEVERLREQVANVE